jgi:hypothetical protein
MAPTGAGSCTKNDQHLLMRREIQIIHRFVTGQHTGSRFAFSLGFSSHKNLAIILCVVEGVWLNQAESAPP